MITEKRVCFPAAWEEIILRLLSRHSLSQHLVNISHVSGQGSKDTKVNGNTAQSLRNQESRIRLSEGPVLREGIFWPQLALTAVGEGSSPCWFLLVGPRDEVC